MQQQPGAGVWAGTGSQRQGVTQDCCSVIEALNTVDTTLAVRNVDQQTVRYDNGPSEHSHGASHPTTKLATTASAPTSVRPRRVSVRVVVPAGRAGFSCTTSVAIGRPEKHWAIL